MKLENHPCKWWSIYLWSWLIRLVLAGRGICFISKPGAFKSCRVYREWIMTWNLYALGAHSDQTNHPQRWFRGMNPLSSHDSKNGRWGGNREGSNVWKGAKFSRWCSEVVELRRNSATYSGSKLPLPNGLLRRWLTWSLLRQWPLKHGGPPGVAWNNIIGEAYEGPWARGSACSMKPMVRTSDDWKLRGFTEKLVFEDSYQGSLNMLRLVLWQVHFALAFKQRLGGFVTRLVPWRLRGTRGDAWATGFGVFKPGWCWWWWSKGYNQPWKPRSYLSHTVNSI